MRNKILKLLRDVGVPVHLLGHAYLVDAIELVSGDFQYIHAITTRLYPDIALRHNTTGSRVERAIRHAIEVAWDRGDLEVLQDMFGNTIDVEKGKATNSEFVATLALHVLNDKEESK